MKKIWLIVFSLSLITLISWCWKLSEKEIFEYNIECQKLLETYKKEHNGAIQEEWYTFLVSDMNAFYSPKENACLLSSKYYENRSSWSRVEYWYTIRTLYGPEKLSRYQEIYENNEKVVFEILILMIKYIMILIVMKNSKM